MRITNNYFNNKVINVKVMGKKFLVLNVEQVYLINICLDLQICRSDQICSLKSVICLAMGGGFAVSQQFFKRKFNHLIDTGDHLPFTIATCSAAGILKYLND